MLSRCGGRLGHSFDAIKSVQESFTGNKQEFVKVLGTSQKKSIMLRILQNWARVVSIFRENSEHVNFVPFLSGIICRDSTQRKERDFSVLLQTMLENLVANFTGTLFAKHSDQIV